MLNLQRGDFIWMERDGKRMRAMVTLVGTERGGQSLIVMFDGKFAGYIGSMALSLDKDGVYRDLMARKPVNIELATQVSRTVQ